MSRHSNSDHSQYHKNLLDRILKRTQIETPLNQDEYDKLLKDISSNSEAETEEEEASFADKEYYTHEEGDTSNNSGSHQEEPILSYFASPSSIHSLDGFVGGVGLIPMVRPSESVLISSPSSIGIHSPNVMGGDLSELKTPNMSMLSPKMKFSSTRYKLDSYSNTLQQELQQKKLELDKVHRDYQAKISEMEARFDAEKHQYEIEAIRLNAIVQHNEKNVQQIQIQTRRKVEELQEKISKLERERPVNEHLKQILKDEILVTDVEYIEIKKTLEEEQTVKEFVQCKVYEITTELKHDLSSLRKENSILNENLQRTVGEFEKLRNQSQYLSKLKEEMDRQYRTELELEGAKYERLSHDLTEKIMLYEECKAKAELFDEVKHKLEDCESNYNKQQHHMEVLEMKLHKTESENDEFVKKVTSLTQQLELLKNDKMYLTKENEQLNSRMTKLQDDYDRLDERYRETKKQKKEFYERLLSFKDETKIDADRNMHAEVKRMREKMKKELAAIKQNTQETFERESRMLREAKEQVEGRCDKLRSQLREANETHEQLSMEYTTLKNTLEKQLNELNSQLNLKTFKNETLNVSLIEANNNLKQYQGENEVMRKKIDVLKSGYYKLQTDSERRIAQLETQLDSLSKELSNYKNIETELDKALEGMGSFKDDIDRRMASDMTTLIPSNATRRMKYSLYLVRKVSDLEKLIQEQQNLLSKKDDNIAVLTEQLGRSKVQLDKVSQPYNYLVSTIEEREKQLEKQHMLLQTSEKDINRLRTENEHLLFANRSLEKDLEKLLNQKNVVSKLKNVLNEIRSDSKRLDQAISTTVQGSDNSNNLRLLISQLTKNNQRAKLLLSPEQQENK